MCHTNNITTLHLKCFCMGFNTIKKSDGYIHLSPLTEGYQADTSPCHPDGNINKHYLVRFVVGYGKNHSTLFYNVFWQGNKSRIPVAVRGGGVKVGSG